MYKTKGLKMKTILEKVKLLNGNMPLSISLMMVCIFYIFGDEFFDIFSLFLNRTDYFEQLLLFGCYWFVQYFFVFFLRRSLFLKPIPSFGMMLTLYFVSYLVITGLAILFNTSAYGFLLFLSSWAWIIFFHKKNVYKNKSLNKPVIKENILNPRFWITLIVASLFIVGAGILIAFCGFVTIFSITIPLLSIENIFLPTLGVSATALLTFYSLIMLRYIIKYFYFGKLSEVEGAVFKKFIKTFLMTVLMYLAWLSILSMIFAFELDGFFGASGIFAAFIVVFTLLTYMIKKIQDKKLSDTDWLGFKRVLQLIGITILAYLLFIPFVVIIDTFLGYGEVIGFLMFSIYNFSISGYLGYCLILRLSDEGKRSLKKIIKTSFLHIGIASVVGWILFFVFV